MYLKGGNANISRLHPLASMPKSPVKAGYKNSHVIPAKGRSLSHVMCGRKGKGNVPTSLEAMVTFSHHLRAKATFPHHLMAKVTSPNHVRATKEPMQENDHVRITNSAVCCPLSRVMSSVQPLVPNLQCPGERPLSTLPVGASILRNCQDPLQRHLRQQ